jgi:hypothetical protein
LKKLSRHSISFGGGTKKVGVMVGTLAETGGTGSYFRRQETSGFSDAVYTKVIRVPHELSNSDINIQYKLKVQQMGLSLILLSVRFSKKKFSTLLSN